MAGDVKTKYLAADGILYAGRTRLKGLHVSVATAGAALIIYDNASAASGTAILTVSAAIAGSDYLTFDNGIVAENGLYLDINGAAGVTAVFG